MALDEILIYPLVEKTGLSDDKVAYGVSMIFCFVSALVFRTIFSFNRVSSITRHYVSIVIGAAVLWFCFKSDAMHLVVMTVGGLVLVNFLSKEHVHKGVFIFAMGYNSYVHFLRMLSGDPKSFDITAPIMFATIRLTYVGFAFHEAYKYQEESLKMKNNEKNYDANKNRNIREFPTTLEVISHMFFFPSILVGPPSKFQVYKDFIDGIDIKRNNEKSSKGGYPSPLIPALEKFFLSLLCAGGFMLLEKYQLCPSTFLDENFVKEQSLWVKIFYSEVIFYSVKFQYFNVFFIGEACVNMAGFGFNGYDQHDNALWDGLVFSKFIEFEKAQGVQDISNTWNIPTKLWLKECLYPYVTLMPALTVFFVSALWHGFYPGYYLYLMPFGICLVIQKGFHKKVGYAVKNSKFWNCIYCSVNFIVTRIMLQYYHPVFVLRNFYGVVSYWRSVYFYGHLMLVVGAIFVYLLPNYNARQSTTETKDKKSK